MRGALPDAALRERGVFGAGTAERAAFLAGDGLEARLDLPFALTRVPFLTLPDPARRRRRTRTIRGRRICSSGAGNVPARFNSTARHRYHAAADLWGPQRSP